MADGKQQEPGGWNRFALEVSDLTGTVENLRKAGIRFRNELPSNLTSERGYSNGRTQVFGLS